MNLIKRNFNKSPVFALLLGVFLLGGIACPNPEIKSGSEKKGAKKIKWWKKEGTFWLRGHAFAAAVCHPGGDGASKLWAVKKIRNGAEKSLHKRLIQIEKERSNWDPGRRMGRKSIFTYLKSREIRREIIDLLCDEMKILKVRRSAGQTCLLGAISIETYVKTIARVLARFLDTYYLSEAMKEVGKKKLLKFSSRRREKLEKKAQYFWRDGDLYQLKKEK